MQDVIKSLSKYIDHSEHINKRMKMVKEKVAFDFEDGQEKKAEKIENVQKSL